MRLETQITGKKRGRKPVESTPEQRAAFAARTVPAERVATLANIVELPKPTPTASVVDRARAWQLFEKIQIAIKLNRRELADQLLDELSAHTGIKRLA